MGSGPQNPGFGIFGSWILDGRFPDHIIHYPEMDDLGSNLGFQNGVQNGVFWGFPGYLYPGFGGFGAV